MQSERAQKLWQLKSEHKFNQKKYNLLVVAPYSDFMQIDSNAKTIRNIGTYTVHSAQAFHGCIVKRFFSLINMLSHYFLKRNSKLSRWRYYQSLLYWTEFHNLPDSTFKSSFASILNENSFWFKWPNKTQYNKGN